jgi:hypothetical protein
VKHAVCVGEKRTAYEILVGNPDEKRPYGRPIRRWQDNIKLKNSIFWDITACC